MVINLNDSYLLPNNLSISTVKAIAFKHTLLVAAKNGEDILENEVNRINNLSVARKENNTISIKEIFIDNWDDYKIICNHQNIFLRSSITTEVEKMIDCKNLKKGYLFLNALIVITFTFKDYLVILDFALLVAKNIETLVLLKYHENV